MLVWRETLEKHHAPTVTASLVLVGRVVRGVWDQKGVVGYRGCLGRVEMYRAQLMVLEAQIVGRVLLLVVRTLLGECALVELVPNPAAGSGDSR